SSTDNQYECEKDQEFHWNLSPPCGSILIITCPAQLIMRNPGTLVRIIKLGSESLTA
ncbi:unnamed protein product, partial [Sphenostylis stenocarpa]